MTAQNLGVSYASAMIPGTDAHLIASRVGEAFGIGTSAAADFVAKVLTAYDDEARKVGPYVKGGAESAKMVLRIASATGVSSGRVTQTLNELQNMVAAGRVGLSTYNPAKYSASAVAKQTVKDAASLVKKAAKKAKGAAKGAIEEITPDAIQKAGSGLLSGIGGLGDVATLLPIVAVVGLGIYAYKSAKA